MPRSPRMRSALIALAAALACLTARPAAGAGYKLARTFTGPEYSYGNAIAANADHLAVGAFFEDRATGAAYLYDRASGALRARLVSPAPQHFFGHDVALDGDLLVVGEQLGGPPAPYDNAGAVHLYDARTGAFLRTLENPDSNHGAMGTAVAAGGGLVAASAPSTPYSFQGGGAVYVFAAATGQLVRTIDDPTPESDIFGMDVAIADGELLVGEARSDQPGTVWRFDLATGTLLGDLHHPDPAARGFGAPLAVDDARIVVGGSDGVVVFDRTTGAVERVLATPMPHADGFGRALGVVGDVLAITQPAQTRNPFRGGVGALFVYDAASGEMQTSIPEPIPPGAAAGGRTFGRGMVLDRGELFVSAGTEDAPEVQQYVPACGDGVVDPCERCDDGNRDAGDGCDAECRLESCGDGVVQAGEDCDDGNAVDGDGCDTTCTVSGCGNCVVAGTEQCDDGNTTTGDACDGNCTWASCQNGEVGPFEACDDGNATPADGCSAVCKAEICGDGALDAGESCDDGNTAAGDGCDDHCHVESARLDWWKRAYALFGGDVGGALFSTGQVLVDDQYLFVLARSSISAAHVYDRETGKLVHSFPGEEVSATALAPEGFLIAAADEGPAVVRLYDRDTFALLRTFEDPTPETGAASFGYGVAAIDGTVLVREYGEHAIHVFDAATGAFLRTLSEPAPAGAATDFGDVLTPFRGGALVSGTSAAYAFDLATGTATASFRAPGGGALAGALVVPVGDDVLAPAADGTVYRLDGATGAVVHTFLPPAPYPATVDAPASTTPYVGIVGDEMAIAYTAVGAVHLHDAATNALHRILRDPDPASGSCFGAPLARLDLGLAVSDPCAGEELFGTIHLFDHSRGQLIATISDPWGDYRDFFGTRGAFGNTLLTKFQAFDDGVVNAWRPSMDGVVEPGEECDDGNLGNGDGCDVNGTIPRCGNGFVTAGETCDDGNRVAGDGCDADCRPSFTCAASARIEHARLTLGRLGGAAGDETVQLTGHLVGVDPARSASAEGVQILIADATGVPLLDLTTHGTSIAPGARGTACGTRDGWRSETTRELYVNASGALPPACVPGSASGLTRLVLGRGTSGSRPVLLRARRLGIPALTSPLHVVIAVGADAEGDLAGRCSGRTFTSVECRANRRGTMLVCD